MNRDSMDVVRRDGNHPQVQGKITLSIRRPTTLREFIYLAYELIRGPGSFPNVTLQEVGEDKDDYNELTKAFLLNNGWVENEKIKDRLTLSNESGMVFASLGRWQTKDCNWYGSFIYAVAFPENLEIRDREIMHRVQAFSTSALQVASYPLHMPGLEVAVIDARDMKVQSWFRLDADRHSSDFQMWSQIVIGLHDLLDLTEEWGYGWQMIDCMTDSCWQWTRLSHEAVKAGLKAIADTSSSEDEIRRRVRNELGYPFDDIRILERKPVPLFGRNHVLYFVEIASPRGQFVRLMINDFGF